MAGNKVQEGAEDGGSSQKQDRVQSLAARSSNSKRVTGRELLAKSGYAVLQRIMICAGLDCSLHRE